MKNDTITFNSLQNTHTKIDKRITYHLAGHAAAIYLGNKQKDLPAVYFQININQQQMNGQQANRFSQKYGSYTAEVEGGRLIQNLPLSFVETASYFSWAQYKEYRCAFEADVINLLVGSLAEAKYVALCDGEPFNSNLMNVGALRFYEGCSDSALIAQYMECLIPLTIEREQKLTELFLAAFRFVSNQANWCAISALASFISNEPKNTIPCEEAISLLEPQLAA